MRVLPNVFGTHASVKFNTPSCERTLFDSTWWSRRARVGYLVYELAQSVDRLVRKNVSDVVTHFKRHVESRMTLEERSDGTLTCFQLQRNLTPSVGENHTGPFLLLEESSRGEPLEHLCHARRGDVEAIAHLAGPNSTVAVGTDPPDRDEIQPPVPIDAGGGPHAAAEVCLCVVDSHYRMSDAHRT